MLVGYPSLLAHQMSLALNNPLIALHGHRPSTAAKRPPIRSFQPLTQSLPCHIHLLNLRSFVPARHGMRSLLFLHHLQSDCDVQPRAELNCDTQPSGDVCLIPFTQLL